MSIYTKRGDSGNTDLLSGERIKKYDSQVEAYGLIDEVNSWLGFAKANSGCEEVIGLISDLQDQLFTAAAELASRSSQSKDRISAFDVSYLENKIDYFSDYYLPVEGFVKPGASKAGGIFDVARTIVRKAERRVVEIADKETIEVSKYLLSYINRLSDLIYTLARVEDTYYLIAEVVDDLKGVAVKKEKLDLELAEKVIEKVTEKAEELEVPMAAAVVDEAGKLIVFSRMDGVLPISIELAPQKAYTAAVLKLPTNEVRELVQPGNELYGLENTCDNIVSFGGGIPIEIDGRVVGAVGVSGGRVSQDIQAAKAGLTLFKD